MELPTVDVMHFMTEAYGYLTQNTAQISRNALASGSCDDYTNRGLAPNAIYFGPKGSERHGASRRFFAGNVTLQNRWLAPFRSK